MSAVINLNKVTHCIFDNDGTLIDTESQYTQAVENLLRLYGKKYTYDMRVRCMELPLHLSTRLLVTELQLPIDADVFEQMYYAELHRLMANVPLMPGVKDLILHFHRHRVPMAIATNVSRKVFCHRASLHYKLLAVFHHIVCGDDPDLKRGKPYPDIFLLAASRFNPKPSPHSCLVFEDSSIGLKAGLAAGMQVVMIPDLRVLKKRTNGASLVLGSMEEFQPELFGLPAYDNFAKFTFGSLAKSYRQRFVFLYKLLFYLIRNNK